MLTLEAYQTDCKGLKCAIIARSSGLDAAVWLQLRSLLLFVPSCLSISCSSWLLLLLLQSVRTSRASP